MQHGLFVFEYEPKHAGWLSNSIESPPDNPFLDGELRSALNNKTYYLADLYHQAKQSLSLLLMSLLEIFLSL